MKTYHMGLVRRGSSLVLQIADSVDQLDCELLKYCGQRENSIANLKRKRLQLTEALRAQGFKFSRFSIERVSAGDFSAGHVSTYTSELAEVTR